MSEITAITLKDAVKQDRRQLGCRGDVRRRKQRRRII